MREIVARPQRVAPPAYHVPPVEAYEAWFEEYRKQHASVAPLTPRPAILRRIAMLRQAGDSFAEIGRCCGMTGLGAKRAYDRLPEELRPAAP